MVYGKLANDDNLKALYAICNDLDDEVLIGAVGRHIENAEQSGSSLAGEWCPKPAQVRFHANALQVEIDKRRRDEIAIREERLREKALTETTTVEFPAGAAYDTPTEITLTATECSVCRDTGFAFYYCPRDRSHPANKYRVFLEPEFLELPEEIQRTFDRFPAVCDCHAGQIRRDKAPHLHVNGVDVNGRSRRVYITIELARKMATTRQAKETQRIGAVSE